MPRLRWSLALVLAAVVGCSSPGQPPAPPIPGPGPTPPIPGPVDPKPTPPTPPIAGRVPYAVVRTIVAGMPEAAMLAAIGSAPTLDTPQDDGSRIRRWPAANATGEPRWLDVQTTRGIVDGYALWRIGK